MQIKNDDKTKLPKICNGLSKKTRKRWPLLSGIKKKKDYWRPLENITELNDLVYVAAVVVKEM